MTLRRVEIKGIKGPFDLARTVRSGQTAKPGWIMISGWFSDADEVKGVPIKFYARQQGSVQNPSIIVKYSAASGSFSLGPAVADYMRNLLGLLDDLEDFYDRAKGLGDEPMLKAVAALKGLRLMRASNLYESLICSIASQNTSVELWQRSVRRLRDMFGRPVRFPDGSFCRLFPKPAKIQSLGARKLRALGFGYRADYVVGVSKAIVKGELDLTSLGGLNYEKAKEALMAFKGIGPKVADCFLLYGLGFREAVPVDIWVYRTVSKAYMHGMKVRKEDVADYLRQRYGAWSGYAQVYLFTYARSLRGS